MRICENRFVQIGNRALAREHIVEVEFTHLVLKADGVTVAEEPAVSITLVNSPVDQAIWLTGNEALAFREWWDNHADVWQIKVPAAKAEDNLLTASVALLHAFHTNKDVEREQDVLDAIAAWICC